MYYMSHGSATSSPWAEALGKGPGGGPAAVLPALPGLALWTILGHGQVLLLGRGGLEAHGLLFDYEFHPAERTQGRNVEEEAVSCQCNSTDAVGSSWTEVPSAATEGLRRCGEHDATCKLVARA